MAQQILVCNDEPHVLRAISLKFTRAGFDVKSVADIESCWRYLDTHEQPSLLIVDFSPPNSLDAMNLVRRIRADHRLLNLPVVVLTANFVEGIEQTEIQRSLEIAQVFAKPFSPREVLEATFRILGHITPALAFHRDKVHSLASNL